MKVGEFVVEGKSIPDGEFGPTYYQFRVHCLADDMLTSLEYGYPTK